MSAPTTKIEWNLEHQINFACEHDLLLRIYDLEHHVCCQIMYNTIMIVLERMMICLAMLQIYKRNSLFFKGTAIICNFLWFSGLVFILVKVHVS
jgi:hypothetical protein